MNFPADDFWLKFCIVVFGLWLSAAVVVAIVDRIRKKKP